MSQDTELLEMLKDIDRYDSKSAGELLALVNLQMMIDPEFELNVKKLLNGTAISSFSKDLIRTACGL